MAILLLLHVTVDILHQEVLAQLLPACSSGLRRGGAEPRQEATRLLGALFVERLSRLVDGRDTIAIAILQLRLHLADVLNHEAVLVVGHVGHPVVNPEGRCPRESQQVAVALAIALRHSQRGGVNGREDGRVGIVDTEPEDAADLVRQPVAHLRHDHEARLLRSDGAFVEILLPVDGEVHRTPAIRHLVRTRSGLLNHIHAGALVVVTHGVLHILYRDLTRGADVERHRLLRGVATDELFVLAHVRELAEEGPHASLAGTQAIKFVGAIGIDEAEILVGALEIALLAGEGDDVRRVHAVLLVAERDVVDTRLIGVGRDAVVRDADSYPYGALTAGSLADHFHDPCLVLVGDGERFAAAVVTVRSHKVGHHLDRFAG